MEEGLRDLCENGELELAFELVEGLDIKYVDFDVDEILDDDGDREELSIKNVEKVLIDIYKHYDGGRYDVRFCYNDPNRGYDRIEHNNILVKCHEVTNISDFYSNNHRYQVGLSKNELCKLIFNCYG